MQAPRTFTLSMTGLDRDAEHVDGARRGDPRAFASLIQPYAEPIHAFLVRLRGHPDDAEDVLQETLIRAWSSLAGYRHQGRFEAWLFAIARNAATDRARSARRRTEAPLPDDLGDGAPGPDVDAANREFTGDLAEALAGLPEARRSVFLLRQESGLTFREIAEVLDIPLGTALSHMHHAVRALKEALHHHEP